MNKVHPNSLKNLRPFSKEGARAGQKNSVISRKANKEAREALKLTLNDWKTLRDEIKDDAPAALDVLKIAMAKALSVEEDLASLKSEMSEIKSLLKELVNGN